MEHLGPFKDYALTFLSCFNDMSASRSTGDSVQPISYTAIKDYSDMMDIQFSSWEVTGIKLLDRAYTYTINEHMRKQEEQRNQNG